MRTCALSLPFPACPPAKPAAAGRAGASGSCMCTKNQTRWPIPGWIRPSKDASKPGTEGAFVYLNAEKGQNMKESSGYAFVTQGYSFLCPTKLSFMLILSRKEKLAGRSLELKMKESSGLCFCHTTSVNLVHNALHRSPPPSPSHFPLRY
jgi:hypothetical protein